MPPDWNAGGKIAVYIDGVLAQSTAVIRYPAAGDGVSVALRESILINDGSKFTIGTDGDGKQLIDDVKVWERELSLQEVHHLAKFDVAANADTEGKAVMCPPGNTDGDGGGGGGGGADTAVVRCTAEDAGAITTADVPADLAVRVLSSKVVVVVTDPTQHLKAKISTHCRVHLAAQEAKYRGVVNEAQGEPWQLNYNYHYAALEIVDRHRPHIFAKLSDASHLTLDSSAAAVSETHLWTNAAREMELPREDGGATNNLTVKTRVASDTDDSATSVSVNSTSLLGSRGFRNGSRGTPPVPSRVGRKLPHLC